jgi:uncharacterized protein YndB with AHSA1/START domain
MPSFRDAATSSAPPEEVWKLLYDPARFPDWWAGVGTVEVTGDGAYTMYPAGFPDFPMAQALETTHTDQLEGGPQRPSAPHAGATPPSAPQVGATGPSDRPVTGCVIVSCLVSDLRFAWRLEPAGGGTAITVDVEIPDAESHRLTAQREAIRASLRNLARLAAHEQRAHL